jgi:CRISPR type III-A-associated RAMP protein Csm5
MEFQAIRTAFHCEVQLLSPVHIGNGEKYVNNFDFICENNKGRIFDHKRLFTLVERLDRDQITSFTTAIEDANLSNWLRSNHVNLNGAVIHSFNWSNHPPNYINRQIRDGLGRPIIPGSSLKGAFRTAILSRLVNDDQNNPINKAIETLLKNQGKVKLEYADSSLTSGLLGKNANVNLMRSLSVADFTFAPRDVQIQEAYVTSLTSGTKFSRKTWSIWLEKLNQGATATGQISFDDFLMAKGKEPFHFKADLTLAWLVEALRNRTARALDSELDFLRDKTGDGIMGIKEFYEKLAKDQMNLPENETIVQFAWGSGWKGMTGELIGPQLLTNEVRNKLRLATNRLNAPFPKTRRVAITGNAALPMGWFRLKFTSKEEIRRAEAIKVQEEKLAQQVKLEREARQREQQEIWEKMSELERCLAIIRGDEIACSQATGQNPVSSCWKRLKKRLPDDQKILAQAFRDMWINDPKTWARNQCTPAQWEKVKLLKAILEPAQEEPVLSPGEQADIERIEKLVDWGAWKNARIPMESITLPASTKLKEKFTLWKIKAVRGEKKDAWKALEKRIRELKNV